MNPPTGTAEAVAMMQAWHEPVPPVVGRMVHYWSADANPKHVRHDQQPFTATIAFVHPDGDVTVRVLDHYAYDFVDTHVPLLDVKGGEMHGGISARSPSGAYCTWPVVRVR